MEHHSTIGRPRFYDLCMRHSLDLDEVGEKAGVTRAILDSLFLDQSVERREAELVLQAVSEITNQDYDLLTVKVRLKLVFSDIWRIYGFRVDDFALSCEVPPAVILAMLAGRPVREAEAIAVLRVLASHTAQAYSLATVSVTILQE